MSTYKKDKRTGVVHNVAGDYEQYLLQKQTIKKIVEQKSEIKTAKNEVNHLKNELDTIKGMLQQLLDKKT